MTELLDKITKDITIQELFSRFPSKAQKLALELTKTGLNCVGCSAATWETIESGMLRHGYAEKDLQALLSRLNAILAEESDPSTVTLTQRAAEKFKSFCIAEGNPSLALRFDERPAGCSGFEYVLEFSEGATAEDIVFHSHGIDIHVYIAAIDRLRGCEIDYVEGLQSGFKISNPNVGSSCGCGSSHGYK
jgi:iron-sulfur cluster assembly protein